MKEFIILIIITILLTVTYLAVVTTYANTPVSEIPLWVFWLIK